MGYEFLFAAAGTPVYAAAQLVFIAASHDFADLLNNHIPNAGIWIILALIIKPAPIVFEDLFGCIITVCLYRLKHIQ